MSTEKLIADAFERDGDRAPDAYRIIAALRATEPKRRPAWRHSATLALVSAAAITMVAVPIVALHGGKTAAPGSVEPAGPGTTGMPPLTVTPPKVNAAGEVAMPFRLGWLPDEFVENSRGLGPGSTWRRSWKDPNSPQVRRMTLSVSPDGPYPTGDPAFVRPATEPVTVNGLPGQVMFEQGSLLQDAAMVTWRPVPGYQMSVLAWHVNDARSTAIRAAESLAPDSEAALAPVVAFGWLPDGMRPGALDVYDRGYGGGTEIDLLNDLGASHGHGVDVQIWSKEPTAPPSIDKVPVTVRGSQGYLVWRHGAQNPAELIVQLPDKRWLRILSSDSKTGSNPQQIWIHVADTLQITPLPTFPWLRNY